MMRNSLSCWSMPDPLPRPADPERRVVASLLRAAGAVGAHADPTTIVNCYVALKSRPLLLLVGPASSGKYALVRALSRVLAAGDDQRCQVMLGHAWWAEHCGDTARFTAAQERLNSEKIFCQIEEARQPANADRIFLACLLRISLAELDGFFSEVAFQLQHGQIMCLPAAHLPAPLPYPDNLLLIGTLDADSFDGWADEDLLSQTTVVCWNSSRLDGGLRLVGGRGRPWAAGDATFPSAPSGPTPDAQEFLRSAVRDEETALAKLYHLPGWPAEALHPLLQIYGLLNWHGSDLPRAAVHDVVVYLANAWSSRGWGLFHPDTAANLAIALDLAMAQLLLPRAVLALRRSRVLDSRLAGLLAGRFPRCAAFLAEQRQAALPRPARRVSAGWDTAVLPSRGEEGLVRDPVCGMRIDPQAAVGKSAYKGLAYYFCFPGCQRAFEREPERYVRDLG